MSSLPAFKILKVRENLYEANVAQPETTELVHYGPLPGKDLMQSLFQLGIYPSDMALEFVEQDPNWYEKAGLL